MRNILPKLVPFLFLLMVNVVGLQAQLSPALYPAQTCGFGGDVVTVNGDGFPADSLLTVTWSNMPLGTIPARVQSDAFGRVAFSFVVPYGENGSYIVSVDTGTGGDTFTFTLGRTCPAPPTPTAATATATHTPLPTPTPPTPVLDAPQLTCPDTVIAGEVFTFFGTRFHPGTEIAAVHWDGISMPFTAPAIDNAGTVTGSLVAPADSFTLHTLTVTDAAGGSAACFPNLIPARPTATPSPSPTLTPTPSPTSTPGPPPGITITPTTTPAPTQICADIAVQYTRRPLAGDIIDAGISLTNTGNDWSSASMSLWLYQNLRESDTGNRVTLPALSSGENVTLPFSFPAPDTPGQVWYQWRLADSPCASDWQPLTLSPAVPFPPGRIAPADGTLLNKRAVALDWLPAQLPAGALPVIDYEVQVLAMADGILFDETVTETAAVFAAAQDYPPGQLAWRVRARNATGWSLWTPSFYFGIDTRPPTVELTVNGVPGSNGWWRSPLTARVGGADGASAFFQPGDESWQQVIPGGTNVFNREGQFTLRAYTRDNAFNRSRVISRKVAVDWTPPVNVAPAYSAPPPASGFFTVPVTVSLRADDTVSGVLTRALRVDGGAWQTNRLYLFADGVHSIDYFAVDNAGNPTEPGHTIVRLDRTPPDGTLTATGDLCQSCPPVAASIAVSDTVSGIAHWTLRANEQWLAAGSDPQSTVSLAGRDYPTGALTLTLTVTDRAGRVGTRTLVLQNAAAPVAATPTPYGHPTATLMPTFTSPAVSPYATASPTPTATRTPVPAPIATATPVPAITIGYPTSGTAVPVLLPVTGSEQQGKRQNEKGKIITFLKTILHFEFLLIERSFL